MGAEGGEQSGVATRRKETKMNELNKKLTEWSNAEEYFTDEDGCRRRKIVRFTEDLNACFERLVPNIPSLFEIIIRHTKGGYQVTIHRKPKYGSDMLIGEGYAPATAFCKAIEELIDSEKVN